LSALRWWLTQIRCAAYLLVFRRLTAGTKAEEGLKSRGWRLSPIIAKDEFIQINLELITTDAVMGSE
jgi:hypothetical protein